VSGIDAELRLEARGVRTRRSDGVNRRPIAIDAARCQWTKGQLPRALAQTGIATMLDAEEYIHLALHAGACMSYLEEVLQREPRNARAIYLMAVQHAELGLTQRAIAGIKTALTIEPDLELARFQLGLLLLFDCSQPSEAKDYLQRMRLSPNRALRAYSEAMIAIADNELTLARQQLAIVLSEASPDAPLSMLMRRLFERLLSVSDANLAELVVRRALAACPPSLS
jgi:tetratricopeptide (TPR) repeat protein